MESCPIGHLIECEFQFCVAVVGTMNEKFKLCLTECKQLNSAGLLRQTGATADKILYNHAIHMVWMIFLRSIRHRPLARFFLSSFPKTIHI